MLNGEDDNDDYYGTIFTDEERLNSSLHKASDDNRSDSLSAPGADNADRISKTFQTQLRKAQIIIKNAEMGLYDDNTNISTTSGHTSQYEPGMKKSKKKRQAIDRTLIVMLYALRGEVVTIELKNDRVFRGILEHVDDNMNCTLVNGTEQPGMTRQKRNSISDISLREKQYNNLTSELPFISFESLCVKGHTIRFVLPPNTFRPRRDVTAYIDRRDRNSRTPKLY